MSTILPKGENLRKAVKWICERRKDEENVNIPKLLDEACVQFNLSPKDADFLARHIKNESLDDCSDS
ncbi:MAG: hypothetical protein QMD09_04755 [Desulfatibacillaceae bacterium]|nr:hypothetical protein [Desulfatibacillaceae bacterium]